MVEEKARWLKGCVGRVRVALKCCALEPEGQVLTTNKGRGQWAAGEARTEDAGEKGFILLVPCIFGFLNM